MITEISKGTLIDDVNDIVVSFDNINKDSPDTIIRDTGRVVPLVKIANSLLDFGSIKYCRVIVGKSFLPTLELSFMATPNFLENDFPTNETVCTVYIGNTLDTDFKSIKCDFTVLSANQSGSGFVDVKGELRVPSLYNSAVKSYAQMSCFDAIKQVCDDTGLGLCSNLTNTDDVMTWLQCNESYMSFIQRHLIRHMWTGSNERILQVYVDAWYRLNVVDVLSELDTEPLVDELKIDWRTGKELNPHQYLVLNNDYNGGNTLARFRSYTIQYDASKNNTLTAATQHQIELDLKNRQANTSQIDAALVSETEHSKHVDAFVDSRTGTAIQSTKYAADFSNVHEHWHEAAVIQDWSQGSLGRVILNLHVPNVLNPLHVSKTVLVEIWKRVARYQDPISDDEPRASRHSGEGKQPKSAELVLNKRLAGKYIITALTYEFTGTRQLVTHIDCQRRLWPVLNVDALK